MIRFACPGCTATFTVENDKAGKSGKCPKCQSQFVIPSEISPDEPGDRPVDLSTAPPPLPTSPPPTGTDPVEIQPCPKCQSRLSVLPADLGLDIECPNCQAVYRAVTAGSSGRREPSRRGAVGGTRGDRDRDRPESEPREWRRREDREDRDSRRSRRREDEYDDEDDPDRRYLRRRRDDDYDRHRYEPHRGGMILAFGIIGMMFCPIFGIVSWTMGSADLKAMDDGRMDPEGRGLTRAGQIIGMVAVLLMVVGVVFYCGIFALAGAAGGFR